MAAAVEEPIAGGRHKVFGHHDLAVIPQTSTIASHLPRAVGIAFAIERARELGVESAWPPDAVVVCSFGDASLNHATAQSALNAAAHFAYRGEPLPLLFVCEDNGLGISVPTPEGWVEQSLHGRPELAVERADGDDPAAVLATAKELAEWVRAHRHPAVLHLRTVRFLSHAGADLETAYRSGPEIRADFARDPLLATGRWLVVAGARSGEELADEYLAVRERIRERALEATTRRQMATAEEVMRPARAARPVGRGASSRRRRRGEADEPLTLAQAIDAALAERARAITPRRSCSARTSDARAASTASRAGSRRASARRACSTRCSTRRRSSASRSARRSRASSRSPRSSTSHTSTTPRTSCAARRRRCSSSRRARTATGWSCGSRATATRRGSAATSTTTTGSACCGTFPGLVDRVARAAGRRGRDAPHLRRRGEGGRQRLRVPRADRAVPHPRPPRGGRRALARRGRTPSTCPVGAAYTHRGGDDLTIVTWANGLYLSLRVARRLRERGIGVTVVDLRWLAPLPIDEVLREASATGRTLVVDETRRTGGVGEGIVAELLDARLRRPSRARREQGLVHPARRRRAARAALRGRDRGGGARVARGPRAVGDPVDGSVTA